MSVRKLFILLLVVFTGISATAQDPHFSQFFASPLTLNPAFTGKFEGVFRLAVNHRDQWPSIPKAYVTTAASADFSILKNKLPDGDVLGVGISGLSDQSANSALKLNYGSISLSYHKALDEDGYNTLGVGFQGTYSSMMVDINKLKFEDQLTQNGFTGVTNESLSNGSTQNYMDMNAGMLFSGSSNGENNYYAGVSMYHINQPYVGFIDQFWRLNSRISIHGGYSFPLQNGLKFHGSLIHQMQNGANETVFGAALSKSLNDEETEEEAKNIYFGSWMRFKDAVIPYLGLEFKGIRLGFSYDVNLSSLKAATQSRGGAEFSLIYIKKGTEKGHDLPCPKF